MVTYPVETVTPIKRGAGKGGFGSWTRQRPDLAQAKEVDNQTHWNTAFVYWQFIIATTTLQCKGRITKHTQKKKFEKTKQAKTELLACPLQPAENYQQKNKEGHCKNYGSYVKHKTIFHFVFKYSTTCCVLSFINMQSRKNKGAWNLLYQNKLHYYDQHKHFFIVQRCANLGGRHIRGQTLLSAWNTKPASVYYNGERFYNISALFLSHTHSWS